MRELQQEGKGGGQGIVEDMEDSLRHLTLPKHMRLACQSLILVGSLLGHTLCIGESRARPDSSKRGGSW